MLNLLMESISIFIFETKFAVSLFGFNSQSLLEMGTKDLSFVQLNQLIGRKTGGISVYPFTSSVRGKEDPCSHLIVRGKSMAGRADDLFNLVIIFLFVFFKFYEMNHQVILRALAIMLVFLNLMIWDIS